MGNKINIDINNLFTVNASSGVTVLDISKEYKKITNKPVMGCQINGILKSLDTILYENTAITLIDYNCHEGNRIYQATLKFIFTIAVKRLWNKKVSFKSSLDKGIFATIDRNLTDFDIFEIKAKMKELIDYDYKIKKNVVKKEDAVTYLMQVGEKEKAENINNIPNNYVDLYEIDHVYNYFYEDMAYSTGEIKIFDIVRIGKSEVVLIYPRVNYNKDMPKFEFNEKIYNEITKYFNWTKKMDIQYVPTLNKKVSSSNIKNFIKQNNVYLDDCLYNVARDIEKNIRKIKIILLGGPSGSGKTTTAKKLCMHLEANGINPIVLSADDYFKERAETPKDKNGFYEFESLEALDLELFTKQINELLAGNEVKIPTYNFILGKKEYNSSPIKMNKSNILLIEGLHCLNDEMLQGFNNDIKYKILVNPMTPIALDCHNYISTTDMRLLRRIVRDNRMRGKNVEYTLRNWVKVKEGEDKYIFPYIKNLNAIVNTGYTYEIGILRVYVEPLLYSIRKNSDCYSDAKRLLNLLKMFFPISSEFLENDNILREFIGGSFYE